MKKFLIVIPTVLTVFICTQAGLAQTSSAFKIGRVHYGGAGDWYVFSMEEPTLLRFIRKNTDINIDPSFNPVRLSSDNLFTYSFLFLTGHGSVYFSRPDAARLREYLENGGFLYANDSYGMDGAFPRELEKVFPNKKLVELPFSYGMYHCIYSFNNGPPKIEDWGDGKPAEGFGLFIGKRLAVYYTAEGDPPDGWDPTSVHGGTEAKHIEAMEFGTNLVYWALTH